MDPLPTVPCPSCGERLSVTADYCPRCGRTFPARVLWERYDHDQEVREHKTHEMG
jgi:predicted amidophosphoribosyltransferase